MYGFMRPDPNVLIDAADIADLYQIAAGWYGHKWSSQFDVWDDGSWLVALHDLTRGQLRRGIERLRLGGAEWPNSAPGFHALCTESTDPVEAAARVPTSHRLPEPEAAREARREKNARWSAAAREAIGLPPFDHVKARRRREARERLERMATRTAPDSLKTS